MSRYQTPVDVYLSKTQELTELKKPWLEAGHALEPAILDWAENHLGAKIKRNQFRVSKDNHWFAATHDALTVSGVAGVEAKTAGLTGPVSTEEWGDEGTDQVPAETIIQVQHAMYVSNLELVWIPALIGGRGFRMYCVERNEKLIERIIERGIVFWERHIIPRVVPEDTFPSLQLVKRVERVEQKEIEVDPELVEDFLIWRKTHNEVKATRDEYYAKLLAHMGDAEIATCERGTLTLKRIFRKGHTVKPGWHHRPIWKNNEQHSDDRRKDGVAEPETTPELAPVGDEQIRSVPGGSEGDSV